MRNRRDRGARAGREVETELERAWFERRALSYLERFDASANRLRMVLRRAVAKQVPAERSEERERAAQAIDELVARYRESGLLNDQRFAESLTRSLRQRGCSARMIAARLRARGVEGADVQAALGVLDAEVGEGEGESAELKAARRLVRRKGLQPHRPIADRQAYFRRDLAALARAGFSMDTARRALEADSEDE